MIQNWCSEQIFIWKNVFCFQRETKAKGTTRITIPFLGIDVSISLWEVEMFDVFTSGDKTAS
jgi:hypothetical protein